MWGLNDKMESDYWYYYGYFFFVFYFNVDFIVNVVFNWKIVKGRRLVIFGFLEVKVTYCRGLK